MSQSQTPNQTPNSGENFSQSTPEIRVLVFDASAYSHTYNFSLLFSLKKKKFVKPWWKKSQQLEYHIYPGVYLLISSRGYIHDESMKWSVAIIKVEAKTPGLSRYGVISSTTWETPSKQEEITIPILRDIDTPGYHGYPKVDYNKIYSQQEIDELLKGGVDPALGKHVEE